MNKFVIYARESSKDPERAPPIEQQIEYGKVWGAQQGWELVKVYSDAGFSGGSRNRPDFNALQADARNRNRAWDIVWCWDADRLARDVEIFLFFARTMKENKVKVYGGHEEIELDTLSGRVKNTSLAQAAEIMRLITSEKVKRAYSSKKEKASKNRVLLKWGRPALKIDMDAVAQLKAQGWGWRRIAKTIGITSHTTIKRRWEAYKALQNTPPKATDESIPAKSG